MSDFGGRLKHLRHERGWRQRDLAERPGVAQTTVANYEQGTRFPDARLPTAVADSFCLSRDAVALGRRLVGRG